jgi:putative hydrolase of the HAD superfamily
MIQNIIFDIGNVLVRWDPHAIIRNTFPPALDHEKIFHDFFKVPIWFALNRGELTLVEASLAYQQQGYAAADVDAFVDQVFASLIELPASIQTLEHFAQEGYRLFALTDNIKEILDHLYARYPFFGRFEGIISSSHVGCLKPDPKIYQYLLQKYQLRAEECFFIDDLEKNIQGAHAVGMQGAILSDQNSWNTIFEMINANKMT